MNRRARSRGVGSLTVEQWALGCLQKLFPRESDSTLLRQAKITGRAGLGEADLGAAMICHTKMRMKAERGEDWGLLSCARHASASSMNDRRGRIKVLIGMRERIRIGQGMRSGRGNLTEAVEDYAAARNISIRKGWRLVADLRSAAGQVDLIGAEVQLPRLDGDIAEDIDKLMLEAPPGAVYAGIRRLPLPAGPVTDLWNGGEV